MKPKLAPFENKSQIAIHANNSSQILQNYSNRIIEGSASTKALIKSNQTQTQKALALRNERTTLEISQNLFANSSVSSNVDNFTNRQSGGPKVFLALKHDQMLGTKYEDSARMQHMNESFKKLQSPTASIKQDASFKNNTSLTAQAAVMNEKGTPINQTKKDRLNINSVTTITSSENRQRSLKKALQE